MQNPSSVGHCPSQNCPVIAVITHSRTYGAPEQAGTWDERGPTVPMHRGLPGLS